MKNILGQSIKRMREEKGWSQSKLSELTNLSQNTISNHENQNRAITERDIVIYATALGVSPQKLFDGVYIDDDEEHYVMERLKNLSQERREKVYAFIDRQIERQYNSVLSKVVGHDGRGNKLGQSIRYSEDFAAHLINPNKIYSEGEIEELKRYLRRAKDEYLDK